MPDPSSLSFPGPSRSNSSASTASSSGASLSRRSRTTRKRTRTITAGSRHDEERTDVVEHVLDISVENNKDSVVDLVASPPGSPTAATVATHPRPVADSVLAFDIRNSPGADRSFLTFGSFGPSKDGHEASPGDSPLVHPPSQPGIATSSEAVPPPPTVRLSIHCK